MSVIEVLWWLGFFCAFGLSVGSFLNVVIYRVPHDISLRNPRWSFCPGCRVPIHWYDNIPVFSYVRLRGRCRVCGMAISPRYPLVEMLGALTVLLLFDALFVGHTHDGLGRYFASMTRSLGITWQLSEDWPILVAHVILFAALLAMSAIDLEHYWVDVRFTTFAAAMGFILHALWTPRSPDAWHRPGDELAGAALAATGVLVVTSLVVNRWLAPPMDDVPTEQELPELPKLAPIFAGAPGAAVDADSLPLETTSGLQPAVWARIGAWLAGACLIVLIGGAAMSATGLGVDVSPLARWTPALLLLYVLIVACGAPRRESDVTIIETIEAERASARKVAALELVWLLPTILAGAGLIYWALTDAGVGQWIEAMVDWSPMRGWHPVRGLGTAAVGFLIGGGIGWLVRILGTLIMGREAFGAGDVHMMAAAGCVAGWPVVLIGFVLCSPLALLGWVLLLPFKRTRAIPMGPWLSFAFLLVVVFYGPIVQSPTVQNVIELFRDPLVNFRNLTGAP